MILLLVSIMALLLMGAENTRLVRLTIVNKSDLPMEIQLSGTNVENFYYLRVPDGDRTHPSETVFTIVPDEYRMHPYYVQIWDPVYGAVCGNPAAKTLYAVRNIRITFLECDFGPRNKGEPTIIKYTPRWRYLY
jgi:hypothetical protein